MMQTESRARSPEATRREPKLLGVQKQGNGAPTQKRRARRGGAWRKESGRKPNQEAEWIKRGREIEEKTLAIIVVAGRS